MTAAAPRTVRTTVRIPVRTLAELTASVRDRYQTRTERTFPGVPASVPAVRTWLAAFLEGLPADVVGDALIATSELVTNAYRHTRSGAGGEITVWAGVDSPGGTVQVVVIDDGPPAPPGEIGRAGGNGKTIIAALTSRNDEYTISGGWHAAWFQIDLED